MRRLLLCLMHLFRRPRVLPCVICRTPVEAPVDGRPVCLSPRCWREYQDGRAW